MRPDYEMAAWGEDERPVRGPGKPQSGGRDWADEPEGISPRLWAYLLVSLSGFIVGLLAGLVLWRLM